MDDLRSLSLPPPQIDLLHPYSAAFTRQRDDKTGEAIAKSIEAIYPATIAVVPSSWATGMFAAPARPTIIWS